MRHTELPTRQQCVHCTVIDSCPRINSEMIVFLKEKEKSLLDFLPSDPLPWHVPPMSVIKPQLWLPAGAQCCCLMPRAHGLFAEVLPPFERLRFICTHSAAFSICFLVILTQVGKMQPNFVKPCLVSVSLCLSVFLEADVFQKSKLCGVVSLTLLVLSVLI